MSAMAAARPVFASLGIIGRGDGCSEQEINEAEQRMKRPFPPDVRVFYQGVRPTDLFGNVERKEFGFYTIGSQELSWGSMEGAEPADDWLHASGLALGQSASGDPFWWIEGHRSLPTGSIVLLDHDGGLGGDVMFVHYARCFREFLAKVAYFKNLYPPAQDELFLREYLELNPSSQI